MNPRLFILRRKLAAFVNTPFPLRRSRTHRSRKLRVPAWFRRLRVAVKLWHRAHYGPGTPLGRAIREEIRWRLWTVPVVFRFRTLIARPLRRTRASIVEALTLYRWKREGRTVITVASTMMQDCLAVLCRDYGEFFDLFGEDMDFQLTAGEAEDGALWVGMTRRDFDELAECHGGPETVAIVAAPVIVSPQTLGYGSAVSMFDEPPDQDDEPAAESTRNPEPARAQLAFA